MSGGGGGGPGLCAAASIETRGNTVSVGAIYAALPLFFKNCLRDISAVAELLLVSRCAAFSLSLSRCCSDMVIILHVKHSFYGCDSLRQQSKAQMLAWQEFQPGQQAGKVFIFKAGADG